MQLADSSPSSSASRHVQLTPLASFGPVLNDTRYVAAALTPPPSPPSPPQQLLPPPSFELVFDTPAEVSNSNNDGVSLISSEEPQLSLFDQLKQRSEQQYTQSPAAESTHIRIPVVDVSTSTTNSNDTTPPPADADAAASPEPAEVNSTSS